jgi:hypothetical protein
LSSVYLAVSSADRDPQQPAVNSRPETPVFALQYPQRIEILSNNNPLLCISTGIFLAVSSATSTPIQIGASNHAAYAGGDHRRYALQYPQRINILSNTRNAAISARYATSCSILSGSTSSATKRRATRAASCSIACSILSGSTSSATP